MPNDTWMPLELSPLRGRSWHWMSFGKGMAKPRGGARAMACGGMVHGAGVATSYPVESIVALKGMTQSGERGLICTMCWLDNGEVTWITSH